MEKSFKARKEKIDFFNTLRKKDRKKQKIDAPDGLYNQCPECKATYLTQAIEENLFVCPSCDYHMRIRSIERIGILFDEGSFHMLETTLKSNNPLDFPGYDLKIKESQQRTGLNDAVVVGTGCIHKQKYVAAVMDSYFMMGSMGSVVGEKITRAIEYAHKHKYPLLIVSCSGGARMQEGIYSLMQMAKTTAALQRFQDDGGFYVSLLTHPTMGGVSASFALLGDINLSEPGALIGFAGQRVIEETMKQRLPKDFQSAEQLMIHGFIDQVIPRHKLRYFLGEIPKYFGGKR